MPEFNIGDRVVSLVDHPDENDDIVVGVAGYVCFLDDEIDEMGHRNVGVRWDERICGGHDCHGSCESGYGWYMYEEELAPEPADEPFEFDETEFNKLMLGGGGG